MCINFNTFTTIFAHLYTNHQVNIFFIYTSTICLTLQRNNLILNIPVGQEWSLCLIKGCRRPYDPTVFICMSACDSISAAQVVFCQK